MKTYIFRDLCRSFALALVLTCGFAACAQGPATRSVVNVCSGEVKTKVDYKVVKTARLLGNTNHTRPNTNPNAVWRQGRRVSLLAWSPFKARTPRAWLVGGKRGKRNR